jgi:catechol 2,3-dioxygenase-like lactoylglutathione lyase family enzyme
MGIEFTRIRQVKVPVTDLQRSVSWYLSLLDLDLAAEFVEQGILRGAALIDRGSGYVIALRDRKVCASHPDNTGFDLFAIEASSVDVLRQLADRCERLGVAHGGVQDRGAWGASLDIPDPDGTVLRFLSNSPITSDRFLGVDFGDDGQPSFYSTPRLNTRTDN